MAPEATLSHLHRADGSATYTHSGYCIIGAVNGPIEVLRRDERPEEATVEVNVRPAVGVGSAYAPTRGDGAADHEDRPEGETSGDPPAQHTTQHHPDDEHTTDARANHPPSPQSARRGQLDWCQSCTEPPSSTLEITTNATQSLTLLPHLLHTALLALLSASIPLSTTITAVLIALPATNTPTASTQLLSPTAIELVRAKPIRSAHVFAFSGEGRMLLNESDGIFSYEEWDEAAEAAEEVCCAEDGGVGLGEGMDVDGRAGENLDEWLRSVVWTKVEHEQRWKSAR